MRPSTFIRAPKTMLLAVLLLLIGVAYPVDGQAVLIRVGFAVASAVSVELLFMYARGRVELPDSAWLTGLIVGMVLGPTVPLGVPVLASAIAVTSKKFIRNKYGHILNPAAFGLLVTALFLSSEQSWWGGLGDLPAIAIVLLAATGLVIAARVNKLPTVLTFLGAYFAFLTAASFLGDPLSFADAFREPMTGAALFFAMFMATDPPTSPARPRDQVWFAVVAAAVSTVCLSINFGGVSYLLIGLLAANVLETGRRAIIGRRQMLASSARDISHARA